MTLTQTILTIILLIHILGIKTKMGFVQEFKQLPTWLKNAIVGVFGIMPFWFIILYYYFPKILEIGWYEKVMFLLVPSFIYYVIVYFTMYTAFDLCSNVFKVKLPKAHVRAAAFGVSLSVFITGSLQLYYHKVSFERYCWILYGCMLILLVFIVVLWILYVPNIRTKRKNNLLKLRKERN